MCVHYLSSVAVVVHHENRKSCAVARFVRQLERETCFLWSCHCLEMIVAVINFICGQQLTSLQSCSMETYFYIEWGRLCTTNHRPNRSHEIDICDFAVWDPHAWYLLQISFSFSPTSLSCSLPLPLSNGLALLAFKYLTELMHVRWNQYKKNAVFACVCVYLFLPRKFLKCVLCLCGFW